MSAFTCSYTRVKTTAAGYENCCSDFGLEWWRSNRLFNELYCVTCTAPVQRHPRSTVTIAVHHLNTTEHQHHNVGRHLKTHLFTRTPVSLVHIPPSAPLCLRYFFIILHFTYGYQLVPSVFHRLCL